MKKVFSPGSPKEPGFFYAYGHAEKDCVINFRKVLSPNIAGMHLRPGANAFPPNYLEKLSGRIEKNREKYMVKDMGGE